MDEFKNLEFHQAYRCDDIDDAEKLVLLANTYIYLSLTNRIEMNAQKLFALMYMTNELYKQANDRYFVSPYCFVKSGKYYEPVGIFGKLAVFSQSSLITRFIKKKGCEDAEVFNLENFANNYPGRISLALLISMIWTNSRDNFWGCVMSSKKIYKLTLPKL